MNKTIALLCLLPYAAWGVERTELDKMLDTAATNQSESYILARNAITNEGTKIITLLTQAGSDSNLSWQQRLVARICCEQIARSSEVDALRHCDWRKLPGYNVQWEKSMLGPGFKMTAIAVPHLASAGLWYYYIEMSWKLNIERDKTSFKDSNKYIPWWGRMALAGQPEQQYLHKAMFERLEKDALLKNYDAIALYQELLRNSDVAAVPVLIERFDAYFNREASGLESYQGERAKTYLRLFHPIANFADSRHADLLEKFIAEHPVLAELKPKLAEVRARPAAVAKPEPPFRLGTNLVVVAP